MKKKMGSFLITALGLALLIYSAARSLDFISLTLPADKQILAFFGLAALDGGLVFWLVSFLYGSHGWQRTIALIMVVVDFLGAVTMFTLDTLLNTGLSGMTTRLTGDQVLTAVIGLSIIIALNVGSTVMHHIMDPENLRQMAEEEARDKIEDLALKEINSNAGQLAHQLAPQIGRAWRDQTEANYQNLLRARKKAPELPEKIQVFDQDSVLPEKLETLPENPTKRAKARSQKTS